MSRLATRCHARIWADHLTLQGATAESLPILGLLPGGNSSVSHNDYAVAYYDDKSILIWANLAIPKAIGRNAKRISKGCCVSSNKTKSLQP